ncbi:MAG: amidase family protein, partial [Betaproteobacteria bacterium]
MNALAIAAAVREGRLRAGEAVGEALARINRHDGTVNAFVRHRGEQALREAAALDAARARGEPLPPLAGVPFAVKDNFDLRGEVTTAGSRVNLGRTPAAADELVVQRLRAAGAIPVGATNMDA